MIKKKLCLLGMLGVGKTSLIKKYVLNIFSENYLVTVGVKVDKKNIVLPDGQEVVLIIWDMEGQDDFRSFADSYLRGLSGYFVVADGTRRESISTAKSIALTMKNMFPNAESTFLINKADLKEQWKTTEADIIELNFCDSHCYKTSAKTGENVEEAFIDIAARMAKKDHV